MSDLPDGMVTDSELIGEMVKEPEERSPWHVGQKAYRVPGWVDAREHRKQKLLLRKQIWQLMGEVAEARERLQVTIWAYDLAGDLASAGESEYGGEVIHNPQSGNLDQGAIPPEKD